MHLFRSEEDVRNWKGFKPGTEGGIVPLSQMLGLFSGNFFKRRMDPDYVSKMKEYEGEFLATIKEVGKERPFWMPKG
jgi:hypothetical protein